ncbi:MAG: RNA polymerase sigma factor [Caulobacteraceae bacterium]
MSADPDSELMRRVGEGDSAAVRELVARKLAAVLRLSRRMLGEEAEAEDVAQETFVRLWRQAGRWRPGVAKLDTWLYRVALNLCHDRLRRRREIVTADPPDRADPSLSQESALERLQMAQIIRAELLALPPRQREAIALIHGEGLSGSLAAEAMGVSLDALESLLARARRSLRARLRECDD